MREANKGTNSRNNENSSVKTMFLTMQEKGEGEQEKVNGLTLSPKPAFPKPAFIKTEIYMLLKKVFSCGHVWM